MKSWYKVHYREEKKGKKTIQVIDYITDERTGEVIEPTCQFFNSPEDYESAGYEGLEPMSAKEPLNEEHQEELFNSFLTIAEEKFDGVRGLLHIKESENRMFSRRVSDVTGWYGDNSDRLPQFRDFIVPDLAETVIDGELIIPDTCFNDISGMLNMDWDKAVERQVEIGMCKFVVFDCIYYKGVYIAKMPLNKRKEYAEKVVAEMNHPLVELGEYIYEFIDKDITPLMNDMYQNDRDGFKETYPELYREYEANKESGVVTLDKIQWYEYVVMHGGEGLMLKPDDKPYEHKRTRSYTKIKKFGTWDVIITRFIEPTKEYKGKDAKTWEYRDEQGNPVTKHYYMGWIGTVAFGVIVTPEELEAWKKRNPKVKPVVHDFEDVGLVLEVGDCSGISEELRAYMTKHQDELIGQVIEVKGHEVMTKTGKIRHPRFVRFREDKGAYQCNWNDHVRV